MKTKKKIWVVTGLIAKRETLKVKGEKFSKRSRGIKKTNFGHIPNLSKMDKIHFAFPLVLFWNFLMMEVGKKEKKSAIHNTLHICCLIKSLPPNQNL